MRVGVEVALTILDVARAAGVSKSTASRVLSGHPATSEDARARVLAAAERLGYRPNRMASGLRGGASHQLGLIITNLVNASFHTITTVMQARAHEAGYQLLLGVSGGDPEQEAGLLDAFTDHRVDGLVIVCTDGGVDQVNRMAAAGIPAVCLVRRPPGIGTPVVMGDNAQGAYQATRYLLELGHRRIAFLGGLPSTTTGQERYAGFVRAHRETGVAVDPALVCRGPFSPAFGVEAVRGLYRAGTDFSALFVANHEGIFGALPELVRRGVHIPNDLSLICYEDVPLFECWHPGITVVDNAPAELGRAAFDVLLARIAGDAEPPGVLRVPGHLVVRESCAPPAVSPLRGAAAG